MSASPANAPRPRMGLIGDAGFATRLADHLSLVPYSESLTNLDGVLVDGQSAASAASEAALSAVLRSGKTLAVANPTLQQLKSLHALTGCGPGDPVPLITYTRTPNSASRYRCTVAPRGQRTDWFMASDTGPGPRRTSEMTPPLGPAVIQALRQPLAGAAPSLDQSSLYPPAGTFFGALTLPTVNLIWTLGYPMIGPYSDDYTANQNSNSGQGASQQPNGSVVVTLWVYYANGQGPSPYPYCVLMQQHVSLICGAQDASGAAVMEADINNVNSMGYFQYQIVVNPNSVSSAQGQPFPSGSVTVPPSITASHAPTGSNGGGYRSNLVWTIPVMATTASGTQPQPYDATVLQMSPIPEWAFNDASPIADPLSYAWNFYQWVPWDCMVNPTDDFGKWWAQMYPNNDQIVSPFPALSTQLPLTFDTWSAWQFDGSLTTPPSRDLWVKFSSSWTQNLLFVHNIAGCSGAEVTQSQHHHLFGASGSWPWSTVVNLAEITKAQYLIP